MLFPLIRALLRHLTGSAASPRFQTTLNHRTVALIAAIAQVFEKNAAEEREKEGSEAEARQDTETVRRNVGRNGERTTGPGSLGGRTRGKKANGANEFKIRSENSCSQVDRRALLFSLYFICLDCDL